MKSDRRHRAVPIGALAALACVIAGPADAPAQPPPDSARVREGACPFECCIYGEWRAMTSIPVFEGRATDDLPADDLPPNDAALNDLPTDDGPPVFTLEPGDTFEAVTGVVHIERPGIVEITRPIRPFTLAERPDRPELSPGDTLWVLDYLGEGHYRVWHDGAALTTYDFWYRPDTDHPAWRDHEPEGDMRVEPRTRWWVRVRTVEGQRGWIEMKEDVRVRGHDACG